MYHPLTAPKVKPLTIYLWARIAKAIGRAIVKKVRTANPPKWNPELRPPVLTYNGKVSWNWLNAKTIRYSFQAKLNIIKLEATIAGIAKGIAIKIKVLI